MMYLGVVFLLGGFFGLLSSYKHVLNMLLSFEFVMLGLLFMLGLWLISGLDELIYMLCFIVFMVGEGVLGLSILVGLVRGHGEDYYLSFNCLQC